MKLFKYGLLNKLWISNSWLNAKYEPKHIVIVATKEYVNAEKESRWIKAVVQLLL